MSERYDHGKNFSGKIQIAKLFILQVYDVLARHGHLVDKVPVSELCEELGLRPTMFYRWQKELFENGAAAFQSQERPQRQVEEKQKRIEFLEQKVRTKDEVLAELMAEHIALKKSLGEL